MRYKLLGRSGLRVSEFCLGTMTFGEDWGWGADKAECRRMFDAFTEAGGNFIDTANHYTNGTAETFVGELVASDRDRFVVATKYTLSMHPRDPNSGGSHRKNMMQSIEGSLRRLGTDYIDLLWVHAWDSFTPIEEVVRGLDDLVRAGKVLYVGLSDAPAWVVSKAVTLADLRGWSRCAAIQIQYSLTERSAERDLLPMAAHEDLAVTAWGTLGAGILSGKYKSRTDRPKGTRFAEGQWGTMFLTERNMMIAGELQALAREMGRPPSQVAIAWVRQRGQNVVIPILGARSVTQLTDNLGCRDLRLGSVQLARLDTASAIPLGFPHDFIGSAGVRHLIYGETFDLIDDHRTPA